MKTNNIEIRKQYRKRTIECIYSSDEDGNYLGKIIRDKEGDYLFVPTTCYTKHRLGKGKCLKEIAERLIELNYPKKK